MTLIPEISLCMIVKNAGNFLSETLNSVKDIISEIIIVDTGSDDNTISVAKKYDAKIFHFKWTDDFSAARNFSISKAKGDWILVLDADEKINKKNKEKIDKLDFENNAAFYLNFKSKINIGESFNYVTNAHPRLFKNDLNIKFSGRIHEQIIGSVKKLGKNIEPTDIEVEHFGYDLDYEELKKKLNRNINLLNKQVEENRESGIDYFHLGETYSLLFDWKNAVKNYKKAIYSGYLPVENRALAYQNLGTAYLNIDRLDEAIEEELNSLKLNPNVSVPHLVIAQAAFLKKEYDLAEWELKKYLLKAEEGRYGNKLMKLEPDFAFVYGLLGDVYFESKNYVSAEKYYKKQKKYNESDSIARLALLYMGTGNVVKGEKSLRDLIKYENFNHKIELTYLKYAEFYLKNKKYDKAKELLDTVIKNDSKNKNCMYLYALTCIEEGDFKSAKFHLDNLIREYPDDISTLNLAGNLSYMTGNFSDAVIIYEKLEGFMPESKDVLNTLGLSYLKTGDYNRAENIYHKIFKLYPDDIEAGKRLVGLYGKSGKIKEAEDLLRELKRREKS